MCVFLARNVHSQASILEDRKCRMHRTTIQSDNARLETSNYYKEIFHISSRQKILKAVYVPDYSLDIEAAISRALTSFASWHKPQSKQHQVIRISETNEPDIPFCSRTFWRIMVLQIKLARGTNMTAPHRQQLSPTFSATFPAT